MIRKYSQVMVLINVMLLQVKRYRIFTKGYVSFSEDDGKAKIASLSWLNTSSLSTGCPGE